MGDFAARTSAPDARPVTIDNQLAQTDHVHLRQLLTCAAVRDAAITRCIDRDVSASATLNHVPVARHLDAAAFIQRSGQGRADQQTATS